MRAGLSTADVATRDPNTPAKRNPIKVAVFTISGPGVISAKVTTRINSSTDNH